MRGLPLLALVLLPLCASAEGLYKWVDEKGVTHYSESPPPDSSKAKKATKVEIRSQGPAQAPAKGSAKAPAPQPTAQSQEKARKDMLCRQALQQVTTLQSERPVYNLNSRGERTIVQDPGRAQRIADAQEQMRRNCEQ